MKQQPQGRAEKGLRIVRDFKAPKALVFDAFANKEAFAQWWGPAGMELTVVEQEFRPGGKMLYKLVGNGQTMWGLFNFISIVAPDMVEFVSSFADEAGNISRSPFPMEFPKEIFNQLTLTENNGITTLTLSGYPMNATPAEEAIYYSIIPNMQQGFAGTFNQLDEYLAKVQ